MSPRRDFTRRKFIARSSAAAAAAAVRFRLPAQRAAESVVPPPKVIAGAVRGLLAGHTARPLRYRPEDGDFVIRNGGEFFNRPLYGPNINFRVDAGDLPEFSLYLPGHGGNLKLGVSAAAGSKWLAQAAEVVARYRPGRMIYEVSDPLLAPGWLRIEVLTMGQGAGFMLQVAAHNCSLIHRAYLGLRRRQRPQGRAQWRHRMRGRAGLALLPVAPRRMRR